MSPPKHQNFKGKHVKRLCLCVVSSHWWIGPNMRYPYHQFYSISQEICTRFLLCCALLWLYIDWFSHIHQGLLHWHCGNLTIAPVPAKQPWWIWINTSCEFIINDCITTTKQSTTKQCAYFLGYTVYCFVWTSLVFGPVRCDWQRLLSAMMCLRWS